MRAVPAPGRCTPATRDTRLPPCWVSILGSATAILTVLWGLRSSRRSTVGSKNHLLEGSSKYSINTSIVEIDAVIRHRLIQSGTHGRRNPATWPLCLAPRASFAAFSRPAALTRRGDRLSRSRNGLEEGHLRTAEGPERSVLYLVSKRQQGPDCLTLCCC